MSTGGVQRDAASAELARLVEEKLTAAMSGYTSKINGELASLRKRVEPAGGSDAKPAPAPLTLDDLKASRQIGAIEAALPENARTALAEACEGLPLVAQARIADAMARSIRDAMSTAQAGAASNGSRGEMPAATQSNVSRAAASAAGAAAEYPRTRAEWLEVRKSDPKRAEMLYRDPAFTPPVR